MAGFISGGFPANSDAQSVFILKEGETGMELEALKRTGGPWVPTQSAQAIFSAW